MKRDTYRPVFNINEHLAQLNALREHFPFRMVYLAVHPTTADVLRSAVTTRRIPNQLAREGYRVWLLTGRGSLDLCPCALCGSLHHSFKNHVEMELWTDAGGTLD